jgi:hypothetical protein
MKVITKQKIDTPILFPISMSSLSDQIRAAQLLLLVADHISREGDRILSNTEVLFKVADLDLPKPSGICIFSFFPSHLPTFLDISYAYRSPPPPLPGSRYVSSVHIATVVHSQPPPHLILIVNSHNGLTVSSITLPVPLPSLLQPSVSTISLPTKQQLTCQERR